jgi:large subunit ribosomal protein L25
MVEIVKMEVAVKENVGTGASKEARRQERIPCIVYGGKGQRMITVQQNAFLKEYYKGNIQTKLFELNVGGKAFKAVIKEVQTHPVSDMPLHIDFQEVDENTMVKIAVHLKITGYEQSVGIKRGGTTNVPQRTIACKAKPADMVEHIVVDITNLKIGQSIHVNDIELPKGLQPIDTSNFVLVSMSGRAEEEAEQDAEGEAKK